MALDGMLMGPSDTSASVTMTKSNMCLPIIVNNYIYIYIYI